MRRVESPVTGRCSMLVSGNGVKFFIEKKKKEKKKRRKKLREFLRKSFFTRKRRVCQTKFYVQFSCGSGCESRVYIYIFLFFENCSKVQSSDIKEKLFDVRIFFFLPQNSHPHSAKNLENFKLFAEKMRKVRIGNVHGVSFFVRVPHPVHRP